MTRTPSKPIFSHNPFSMPQGGMEALTAKNPHDILAYQYDIVCNGVELSSSGAIRNHRPEIMYKAFEIAGYTQDEVDRRFAGMINALKYGAPSARRLRARGRPHRHAARRRAQYPRSRRLPDEPKGGRPDDGRTQSAVDPRQLRELSLRSTAGDGSSQNVGGGDEGLSLRVHPCLVNLARVCTVPVSTRETTMRRPLLDRLRRRDRPRPCR